MIVNTKSNNMGVQRVIHRGVYTSLVLAILIALSGCAGTFDRTEPGSVADLERSDWVLSDIAGVDVITDRRPTLKFANGGEANGFSGCNRYRGTLVLSETDIAIADLALTRLGCRISVMEFEQAYIERLQNVSSWTIQRHSLRLKDSSGVTQLRFRRIGTPAGSNI